jgi:hypothetical protein
MGPLRPHSFHTSAAAVLGYIQEIIIMSGKSVGSGGVLRSGVKFNVIPETLESPYKDLFPAFDNKGLVRAEPGGFVYHQNFADNCHKIYNMKVRSDDVWIRTFPRSGNFDLISF